MHCVVVVEPALPIETLTIEDQIHEVAGPFADESEALQWVSQRKLQNAISVEHAIAPSRFRFLVTEMSVS